MIEDITAACGDLRIAMAAKLAIHEITRLTAERDEARRMYCRMMSNNSRLEFATPQWFAEEEDWDCFKEDGK